jgi:hypothetical protein
MARGWPFSAAAKSVFPGHPPRLVMRVVSFFYEIIHRITEQILGGKDGGLGESKKQK